MMMSSNDIIADLMEQAKKVIATLDRIAVKLADQGLDNQRTSPLLSPQKADGKTAKPTVLDEMPLPDFIREMVETTNIEEETAAHQVFDDTPTPTPCINYSQKVEPSVNQVAIVDEGDSKMNINGEISVYVDVLEPQTDYNDQEDSQVSDVHNVFDEVSEPITCNSKADEVETVAHQVFDEMLEPKLEVTFESQSIFVFDPGVFFLYLDTNPYTRLTELKIGWKATLTYKEVHSWDKLYVSLAWTKRLVGTICYLLDGSIRRKSVFFFCPTLEDKGDFRSGDDKVYVEYQELLNVVVSWHTEYHKGMKPMEAQIHVFDRGRHNLNAHDILHYIMGVLPVFIVGEFKSFCSNEKCELMPLKYKEVYDKNYPLCYGGTMLKIILGTSPFGRNVKLEMILPFSKGWYLLVFPSYCGLVYMTNVNENQARLCQLIVDLGTTLLFTSLGLRILAIDTSSLFLTSIFEDKDGFKREGEYGASIYNNDATTNAILMKVWKNESILLSQRKFYTVIWAENHLNVCCESATTKTVNSFPFDPGELNYNPAIIKTLKVVSTDQQGSATVVVWVFDPGGYYELLGVPSSDMINLDPYANDHELRKIEQLDCILKDATWEFLYDLQLFYPKYDPWGQGSFQEEGNDAIGIMGQEHGNDQGLGSSKPAAQPIIAGPIAKKGRYRKEHVKNDSTPNDEGIIRCKIRGKGPQESAISSSLIVLFTVCI